MLGIGSNELAIILVFGFLLFGPDKLPQMGRTIGRALRQFKETQEKMTSMVQAEVIDPMAAAANAPTKPKKTTDAADDDSDADAPASSEDAPRQKETFAERRARLAAEKAQKEQAEQGAGEAVAAGADAAPAAPAEEAAAPEPEEVSEDRATADLYARRPRKKKAPETDTAASDATSSEGGEQ